MEDAEANGSSSAGPADATESLDDLAARHRKEARELQNQITALKKAAASDKKRKKELPDRIAEMEEALKKRHAAEREELEARTRAEPAAGPGGDRDGGAPAGELDALKLDDGAGSGGEGEGYGPQAAGEGKKKRNRQKERKEKRLAEMEEARRQAAEEAKNLPDLKRAEEEAMRKLVAAEGLVVKEIPADGHCLYNAIIDQLGSSDDYKALRKTAAQFMLDHADDFVPFMTDANGDMLDDDGLRQYCDDLVRKPVWGGDLEIQALSRALARPIHVYQQHAPVLRVGEDFAGKPLRVSYHRHALALGAHYNSLREA
ncbi:OTU domain-containing protein 6B [Hyaloraphidium curvatum]|nr:OTU domain-containing protein 6B [Hyaloraphidium curvatum]